MVTNYSKLVYELFKRLRRGYYTDITEVRLVHGLYYYNQDTQLALLSWSKDPQGLNQGYHTLTSEGVHVGYLTLDVEEVYTIANGVWERKPHKELCEYLQRVVEESKAHILTIASA